MAINRQATIDRAIVDIIENDMLMIPEARCDYEAGDSITDLEVVTGEEDPDHWQRIPEVWVDQSHINRAKARIRHDQNHPRR